jgi:gluconate 2-dehydrogenase gamma chain
MAYGVTRREMVVQLGAVWAALAQTPAAGPKFFTPEQGREVEAITAQILPADELGPGAREAGVVAFIDLVLASFERDKQAIYREGLKELGAFAALDSARQVEKLKAIEKTPFFETIREHTITGFFSHPKYGGNRDGAGFKLLNFEDRHMFEPPFGYYDGPEGGR